MNTTAVSLYEYLHTDYSPDVDYIDGEIEERNVGEYDHANLQTLLTGYFLSHRKEWGIRVVVEQRVQVSPTRFRVPDITIITKRPESGIITAPPLLCIEILSPDDTRNRIQRRIDDYLRFGVPYVWEIDPDGPRAWIWTSEGAQQAEDGVLTAGHIRVPLADIGD